MRSNTVPTGKSEAIMKLEYKFATLGRRSQIAGFQSALRDVIDTGNTFGPRFWRWSRHSHRRSNPRSPLTVYGVWWLSAGSGGIRRRFRLTQVSDRRIPFRSLQIVIHCGSIREHGSDRRGPRPWAYCEVASDGGRSVGPQIKRQQPRPATVLTVEGTSVIEN
jgi:hypothetical protein